MSQLELLGTFRVTLASRQGGVRERFAQGPLQYTAFGSSDFPFFWLLPRMVAQARVPRPLVPL